MSEKQTKCMLCGKPSNDSICESCKAQVQGEAADKKMKIEKSVKVGEKIEADKKTKHKS